MTLLLVSGGTAPALTWAASVAQPTASVAQPTASVAQPTPAPVDPGGQGEDFGKSSPVGLVILVLFFLAVVLLVRSMNKHLRRVPESFDKDPRGE